MTRQAPITRQVSRRQFASAAAAGLTAASLFRGSEAQAASNKLIATPPAGFTPVAVPGKVVKVAAKGDFASIMQTNQLWPKEEIARRLLEKAMIELTGAANMAEA